MLNYQYIVVRRIILKKIEKFLKKVLSIGICFRYI